jgi:hypothetical protein
MTLNSRALFVAMLMVLMLFGIAIAIGLISRLL